MSYFDRTFWRQTALFLLILAAVAGVVVYTGTFAKETKVDPRQEALDQWAKSYTDDRFGGETPAATVALLAAALEKGDLDLASKYFLPDDQVVMKGKFELGKQRGTLAAFITVLRNVKKGYVPLEGQYQFSVDVGDPTLPFLIDLVQNPATKVWKLERL